METRSILSIVAICAMAIGAASLAYGLAHMIIGRSRTTALRKNVLSEGAVAHLVRVGVPFLFPLSERIRVLPYIGEMCNRLSSVAHRKGLSAHPSAVASIICAAGIVSGWWGLIQQSPAPLGLYIALLIGVSAWASSVEDRVHDQMRNDLPDALRAMSACFHAGFTLPQTFDQLQIETQGPLRAVFVRAAQSMKAGRTAHEALAEMREKSGIAELSFISVALEVQHESGGSMQHVLDATGDMLKSELDLKRSLKVQTAQARLSARVVVAVTIGLVAVLMGLTEDFLTPFFSSVAGFVLLACALGMQALGIVLVRRMLHVQGA